jgi:hypothetical protein
MAELKEEKQHFHRVISLTPTYPQVSEAKTCEDLREKLATKAMTSRGADLCAKPDQRYSRSVSMGLLNLILLL